MKKYKIISRVLAIAGIVGLLTNVCTNTSQAWEIDSCMRNYGEVVLNNNLWVVESPANAWNLQFSGTQFKTGTKSLRVELRNTDAIVNGSKRCEVARYKKENAREEHWYLFSIYLPASGTEEYLLDPEGSEILAQWHNKPDPGEEWTNPPLALRTFNDYWCIDRAWDANALSTSESIKSSHQYESVNLGSYLADKGKWTDWAFHVKWGWLPEHNTILEVYKNGVLVFERNGYPNTTNDQVGVVQKLGIYKWDWAQNNYGDSVVRSRVVYFDDGSTLNDPYSKAIEKLVNKKIVSAPDYWTRLTVNTLTARGDSVKTTRSPNKTDGD